MPISPDLFALIVVPGIALGIAVGGYCIVVVLTPRKATTLNPYFARSTMWEAPRSQPVDRHPAE